MNQTSPGFNYLIPGFFYIFFIVLTLLVSGHLFFWDTIQLGSKHAHFFFEQEKLSFLLPDSMDSGHMPAFGFYLSLMWKIFGKNLLVSHFSVLPFLLGIVCQTKILLQRYLPAEYLFLGMLFFLADPTFLAQAVLITPDIPLLFFFLFALNSLFHKNRYFLSLAITGLFLTSMRGMMAAFSILLVDLFSEEKSVYRNLLSALFKKSLAYLPAAFILLVFSFYHYKAKGWVGYHKDSPWTEAFERVDIHGFLYNIGILGWRLIDFGRVFLWITFGWLLLRPKPILYKDPKARELFFIWATVLVCLSATLLFYKNLSGHRYLLPAFSMFGLMVFYFILKGTKTKAQRVVVLLFCLAGLFTGNLWVYPEKIAQGWDSSLAHLPYYRLRSDMMDFIYRHNIPIKDIGSAFPNATEFKYLDLTDDSRSHAAKNLDTNPYVLYSNVYNDFSDEEIDRLNNTFILIHTEKRGGVFIKLFRNPGIKK